MLLSISELSSLTGKDRRTIKRHSGTLPVVKDGKAHMYESKDLLPLLYGVSASDGEKLDLSQERARLTKLQADKASIELKAIEGEYAKIEEVAEEVGAAFFNVRAKLLSLPTKLTPLVYQEQIQPRIHQIIKDAIYEALEDLSSDFSGDDADPRTMAERAEKAS